MSCRPLAQFLGIEGDQMTVDPTVDQTAMNFEVDQTAMDFEVDQIAVDFEVDLRPPTREPSENSVSLNPSRRVIRPYRNTRGRRK